jgi:ABC-type transporter Mla MlaB component
VALDLGEVSLICSTGIGSILHNVRKYQEHECTLMLVSSSAYVQELFALFGCHAVIDDNFFHNWRTLEKRMQSQGLALTE